MPTKTLLMDNNAFASHLMIFCLVISFIVINHVEGAKTTVRHRCIDNQGSNSMTIDCSNKAISIVAVLQSSGKCITIGSACFNWRIVSRNYQSVKNRCHGKFTCTMSVLAFDRCFSSSSVFSINIAYACVNTAATRYPTTKTPTTVAPTFSIKRTVRTTPSPGLNTTSDSVTSGSTTTVKVLAPRARDVAEVIPDTNIPTQNKNQGADNTDIRESLPILIAVPLVVVIGIVVIVLGIVCLWKRRNKSTNDVPEGQSPTTGLSNTVFSQHEDTDTALQPAPMMNGRAAQALPFYETIMLDTSSANPGMDTSRVSPNTYTTGPSRMC